MSDTGNRPLTEESAEMAEMERLLRARDRAGPGKPPPAEDEAPGGEPDGKS